MPTSAAAVLVARFRAQRPLRGGSLIVTIFGDSLMPRGGAIALGSLIDLTAPFGLKERLVRTAAARLAQDGTLEARRVGKLSEYRLSKNGQERFADATQRIYSGPNSVWSGRWTLIVIPPMATAARNALREELIWRGFGELSPHVFAHPEIDPNALCLPHTAARGLAQAIVFDADLSGPDAPSRLISLGWDLRELGSRYRRFVQRFQPVYASLAGAAAPEEQCCFIIRTLLIHEYRRLHLRDPMLPATLLRPDWPGAQAAELCRQIYARTFGPSETYLSRVASQLAGRLPPPDPSIMQRFGGIAPSHSN